MTKTIFIFVLVIILFLVLYLNHCLTNVVDCDGNIFCGKRTINQGGVCTPNYSEICGEGTTNQEGVCKPN